MNLYTAGNEIKLTCVFTVKATGAAVDPTTVTAKVRKPDGTVDDLSGSVTKTATGNYWAPYTPDAVGVYQYEWSGSGSVEAAYIGKFFVTQQPF